MTGRRLQFSLRAVFAVSFLVAILCSLIKCEMDARSEFERTAEAAQNAVAAIEHDADERLYDYWLDKAKRNLSLSRFVDSGFGNRDLVGCTSGRGSSYWRLYPLGAETRCWIRKELLSPDTDFSKTPWEAEYNFLAIDLHVVCSRPWSVLSRNTSVTLEVHQAPENELLLSRLKAQLDKAGVAYDVEEPK